MSSATPLTPKKQITLRELRGLWVRRIAVLTWKELLYGCAIVAILWTSNTCSFFGMNFWLWSFNAQSNSNYVSIWLPALTWALAYFFPIAGYKALRRRESGNWSAALSTKRALGMLVAIGCLDSLGGLTALYSAKPTPIFLQTMLAATGPIWTFFLTRILYPARARPFTIYPAIAFFLIAVGIIVSGANQFSSPQFGSPYNVFWVLIYLAGIIIPCVYGIISGRFIHDYAPLVGSKNSTYMIVLCGDTISQLVFTTMYFPLDAVPWFGSPPYTLSASWSGFVEALKCVASCPNNAIYMALYAGGFWVAHVVGVVMNHYSPTLLAVVSLLNGPLYVFLLIVFPSLRTNGAPGAWYLDLLCFVCLLTSCILFIIWEESVRFAQSEEESSNSSGGLGLDEATSPPEKVPLTVGISDPYTGDANNAL